MKVKLNKYFLFIYIVIILLISLVRMQLFQNREVIIDIWTFNFGFFNSNQFAILDLILIITPFVVVHIFMGGILEDALRFNAPLFFSRYEKRSNYMLYLFKQVQANVLICTFVKLLIDLIAIKIGGLSYQFNLCEIMIVYCQIYLNFVVIIYITYVLTFFVKRAENVMIAFYLILLLCFVIKDSVQLGFISNLIPVYSLTFSNSYSFATVLWFFIFISLCIVACHTLIKKYDFI